MKNLACNPRPLVLVILGIGLPACMPAPPELDDPLPGLTPEQLERFEEGEAIFESEFTVEQGVGPLFNAEGCAVCHAIPTDGGNGVITELHATGVGSDGCDPLTALGGPVFQQRVTPALAAALGIDSEPVPPGAHRATRTTPDIFGFGLLDAVPDETIEALADPDDRDGDGISGRVHRLPDGRMGRFGRKASMSSLAEFNQGAFLIEMGLTTPELPEETSVGGDPLPPGVDPAPDPELTAEQVARVEDYLRFLAPPAPAPRDASAEVGRTLFARIGCAACHVPTLRTGDHVVAALANQEVHAYTDLLLHDMGPGLADICLGTAEPEEFRTEPLMGLRHVPAYLHDGRASTLEEAIHEHDGEARASREAFEGLADRQRRALLAFLQTL